MTFLLGMGFGALVTIAFSFLITADEEDIDN